MPLCHRRRFVSRVKGMKRRPAPKSSRTRSQWWSCVLSVLVALSLLVRPADICALVESSPGHSQAHASEHSNGASSGHSHDSANDHDGSHHHDGGAWHESSLGDGRMSLTAPGVLHACCADIPAPHPVVVSSLRAFQADDKSSVVLFASATLPLSPGIFALTACHGRDGPSDKPFRSQFLPSSRLGRAPPALA